MTILLILGVLTGLLTWAFTKETLFQEIRTWLAQAHARATGSSVVVNGVPLYPYDLPIAVNGLIAKLTYLPLCDYCFAHWIAAGVLVLFQPDPISGKYAPWINWLLSWSVVTAVSVIWTSAFGLLRRLYQTVGDGKVVTVNFGSKLTLDE